MTSVTWNQFWFFSSTQTHKVLYSNMYGNLYLLLSAAEKVTEKLTEMTGQVAPADVSSVYGIRRAMGIALPTQPPESFIDLTTGKYLSCHFKNKNIYQATSEIILLAYSAGDGWTDGDCVQLSGCSSSRRCIVQVLPSCNLMKCSFLRLLYALQLINSFFIYNPNSSKMLHDKLHT